MEIIELAHQRKAFIRTKDRYRYPHKEAMKLRLLWTYDKPPSRSRDSQEARHLYREACKHVEDAKLLEAQWMLTKGLKLDPKFHALYAVKGDINLCQKRWTEAIKNFEHARTMAKYDKKLSTEQVEIFYNMRLIESYSQRGHWYYQNSFLIEAASDYEQVVVLNVEDETAVDIQNHLLDILRRLDKYDAFRFYWYKFTSHANELRATILLILHAEYKIYLQEVVAARQILLQALDLDKNNAKAQDLLQIVYKTGHTMAAHTVIWCMHGCYEKALLTIEKARDCDPYNIEYVLLKTIILRLSSRLTEAAMWLQSVDKDFYKFVKSSRDTQDSIFGKLTIKQIKEQLVKQWYLIQYDVAMEHMLNGDYEQACKILQASIKNHHREACVLLGDSLLLRGHLRSALATYLRCHENFSDDRPSWGMIQLIERIVEILNCFAHDAARAGRTKETIYISDRVLKILNQEGINTFRLAAQRAETLSYKARSHLRISTPLTSAESHGLAADSLRFTRGHINDGLYRALFANAPMERVVDRFAPTRDLPHSLKILMQYC